MSRKTVKPTVKGCRDETASYSLCGLFRTRTSRDHKWEYSTSWNGNDREVLPFSQRSSGIARAGWRCYHCGKFVWDQSDTEFALSVAHAWGLIKIPTGK